MEIKSEVLKGFLGQIGMYGTSSLLECILDFNEKEVYVIAQVSANTVIMQGRLDKKAFEKYEPIGKIGIENLTQVKEYVKRLNGVVTITKKDNVLVFKAGNKKVEVLLREAEFIEAPPKYPAEVEKAYDTIVELDYSEIKDFVEDMKAVVSRTLTIETAKNTVTLKTKNMDTITKTVTVEQTLKPQTVKLAENFIEVLSGISGKIELRIKSDYPVTIGNKTENTRVDIIVSPASVK